MSFVRTVLADIEPTQLGVCYAHEHIIIDRSFTTYLFPDFLLDSVESACTELSAFKQAGGNAMIDSMPCGGGRNVLKLAEISRRTGVYIVCPTGLHLAKYYPPGHWGERLSSSELAELFIADIIEGIDSNDYSGPTLRRTTHRAGLIKVAGGLDKLSPYECKVFEAAAAAHRATGAPILTHTEQGTAALAQIELLASHGVDLSHVVLSHTDRKADVSYHKEILSTGVNVEFDSAFRWPVGESNPTENLVAALFLEGYTSQILLGMDAARRSYWRSYGGSPGLTFLLEVFRGRLLERGMTQTDLHRIFVQNPAKAYAFTRTIGRM